MPRKSIRLRLQLWFGFLLAILLAGLGAIVCRLQRIAVLDKIDADLAQRVNLVSGAFRSSESGHGPPPHHEMPFHDDPDMDVFFSPMDEDHPPPPHEMRSRTPAQLSTDIMQQFTPSNRCYFAVWGAREKSLLAQSSPDAAALPIPESAEMGTLVQFRMRNTCREAFQYTEQNDCVLAGCDIAPELAKLHFFAWQVTGIALFLLAAGLGGGFVLSGLLLQSVHHISHTAQRISEGTLSERIPSADMDRELGQLADVLNATFARLEAAFARQRQFTADAAHELRTPLAVIISETQTALRRERNAEEYRDTIHACEEAAQKMRRLAESLLELARLDAGNEMGPRAAVDLVQIVQDHVEHVQPLAALRNIQFKLDLQVAKIMGYSEQIGRVIANLFSNAIDYNKPGGLITVRSGTEHDWVFLSVEDTGVGIDPGDLPRIFDRFYRASRTRNLSEGHSGLGLAICKGILEANGGRIEVISEPGKGSSFTLRWPSDSVLK